MDTKLSAYLAVAFLASVLTACGQDRDTDRTTNQPQTTTPATPPPATPPASNDSSASGMTPPECDFSDHDTSQMSGEEHRRMMEQCEAAKRRNNSTGTEGSPSGASPSTPSTSPNTTPSTPPSTAPRQ